jgi:hypothetical protein
VFDVEEEFWSEPIPVGNGSFICTAQHEKQLCLINRTYSEEEITFGLWKFDMEQRVWGPVEFIPPLTTTRGTYYHVWGGSEFFWVEERNCMRVYDIWNRKEKMFCMWVYDILHHSWLNLGNLGLGKLCFEGSLFRLT